MWGIYVHTPWCHRRCPYCDFYFEVGKPKAGFASKVLQEYAARRAEMPHTLAHTLYLGGGTPSLLPAAALAELITGFRPSLESTAEITLELNPEDISAAHAIALKEAGINRVSIGVQSCDDAILKQLGRRHRSHHVFDTLAHLQAAGIDRMSVDMIVGVPGENRDTIQHSLEKCAQLGVSQFSVYLLTIEDNTPLHRLIAQGKQTAPDPDAQADVYEWVQTFLKSLGFQQYEISSYAKPGQESRHNRIYWSQGEYIGLGPGAHSMRLLADGSVCRRHTTAQVTPWWPAPEAAACTTEVLDPPTALQEALAFGLRDLVNGIQPEKLAAKHQSPLLPGQQTALQQLVARGWLQQLGDRYTLTPQGARFADAVARMLL